MPNLIHLGWVELDPCTGLDFFDSSRWIYRVKKTFQPDPCTPLMNTNEKQNRTDIQNLLEKCWS